MTRDPLTQQRCEECGRYMRPMRSKAADYPTTYVSYGGRGLCGVHYRKLRDQERAEVGLPPTKKREEREKYTKRAPMKVWDRHLSVDDQRVLYMVLRRFRGEEQGQVAGMLGLTDGT